MSTPLSRRDFLKISGLSLAALASGRLLPETPPAPPEGSQPALRGRVTRRNVPVYQEPDFASPSHYRLERDALIDLLEEIISPDDLTHNPRWYRLEEGFVHSAYIQRVDGAHESLVVEPVPEGGMLAEVSVPIAYTQFKDREGRWVPLYRLYYGSTHWVTRSEVGEDGQPWYSIVDDWLRIRFRTPAAGLRAIQPEDIAPISQHIPPQEKSILVSLDQQTLTAYERGWAVYQAQISSGVRYMETPVGEFRVQRKHPSRHMGDGGITSRLDAYELLGVPWVSFFHEAGIAFHGTYWHDNFGTPMSRGCVNLSLRDARWLFRWCAPAFNPHIAAREDWQVVGEGTRVTVTGNGNPVNR